MSKTRSCWNSIKTRGWHTNKRLNYEVEPENSYHSTLNDSRSLMANLEKWSILLSSGCDYILWQAVITRVQLSQGETLIVLSILKAWSLTTSFLLSPWAFFSYVVSHPTPFYLCFTMYLFCWTPVCTHNIKSRTHCTLLYPMELVLVKCSHINTYTEMKDSITPVENNFMFIYVFR